MAKTQTVGLTLMISRISAQSSDHRSLRPRTQGQGIAHLEPSLGLDPLLWFREPSSSRGGKSPRFTQGGEFGGEGPVPLILLQQLLSTHGGGLDVCSE